MAGFVEQILAFPTLFYSALLVVVFLYWGLVIIGAIDIDILKVDGLGEGIGAKLDGLGEGIGAKLDGLGEGIGAKLDGLGEGVGAKLDGLGEGVGAKLDGLGEGANAAAEAAGEGAASAAGALHSAQEGLSLLTFLSWIGLRRAPITVTASILTLFAWALCVLGMKYLAPIADTVAPHWLTALLVFVGSTVIALPITGLSARPLGSLAVVYEAERMSDLVGKTCTIDTGRVGTDFGQAVVDEIGSALIHVRCRRDGALHRGDSALIVAYDPAGNFFLVEPMASETAREAAPAKHPLARRAEEERG